MQSPVEKQQMAM